MNIPKKFTKTKKSFVDRLALNYTPNQLSSFCSFPDSVTFNGQEKNEDIILLIRKHPAVFIPQYFSIFALLIAPVIMISVFNALGGVGAGLMLGSSIVFLMIATTFAFDTFLKWYYSVSIITDQRIVDVDFSNVLYHRVSEAQLEKIEDVSHAPAGLLSSIFDYGDVYIQTAGTKPEFDFIGVPKPRDVQDTLLDLLEMKQNNQI